MTFQAEQAAAGELVDFDEFFAPVPWSPIGDLLTEYRINRTKIDRLGALVADSLFDVVHYFVKGNVDDSRAHVSIPGAKHLFSIPGAAAALDATFWKRALELTDFYSIMPQKRRDEWNEQIQGHKTPEFTEENIRATFEALEAARMLFFAERVDGIFRALSGSHVTNSPAAFGERMIIAHLVSSYGTTNCDRVGYINDLRAVIAKFMGRSEPPHWNASSALVEAARKEFRGQWISVDGGSFRLRAYKCGTAHLEVHPDMAWRLNAVLAHLHPMAIPPRFREKPSKAKKVHQAITRPLPFSVIAGLQNLETAYSFEKNEGPDRWRREHNRTEIRNALQFRYGCDEVAIDEVRRVLAYIGAVEIKVRNTLTFQFDYPPREVLSAIICTGTLPDQKTHQFYPTPETVARDAVAIAGIGDADRVLEPSAGLGGLADLLPKDRTTCVEISDLHCKVLEAKGYRTDCCDFLKWAVCSDPFDRIVMNPPFADGRALAHLRAAADLVATGGRIVAVLPASMVGKDLLPGWNGSWSRVYSNEFAGTSVSVAIFAADRPTAGAL